MRLTVNYFTTFLVVFFPHNIYPYGRLDRQTQATTFIHQVFGGYLRSRGKLLVLIHFLDLSLLLDVMFFCFTASLG